MTKNSSPSPSTGLLLCKDLFFSSKVTGTAEALGLKVDVLEDSVQLAEKLTEFSCRCLILDLAMPGLNVAEVVESLPAENRPVVIAFGSHVLTELLQSAREAGCDEVMPKSQFVSTLAKILKQYLT